MIIVMPVVSEQLHSANFHACRNVALAQTPQDNKLPSNALIPNYVKTILT